MSLPVFYVDDVAADRLVLTGPEGRHAVTVQRIRPGDHIELADAQGHRVTVHVDEVTGKNHLEGSVVHRPEPETRRPHIVVVQALPKSERSELAIDLATQAGADEFIPWQAARCEAKWVGDKIPKHLAKWRNAARAAAKQSRRAWVPPVAEPVTTKQLAELLRGETAYVLHEQARDSIRDVDVDVDKLYLLVGPEGGIGDDELAVLDATPVRLGPEVYRTASAAMVAISAIGALTRW